MPPPPIFSFVSEEKSNCDSSGSFPSLTRGFRVLCLEMTEGAHCHKIIMDFITYCNMNTSHLTVQQRGLITQSQHCGAPVHGLWVSLRDASN